MQPGKGRFQHAGGITKRAYVLPFVLNSGYMYSFPFRAVHGRSSILNSCGPDGQDPSRNT